MANDKPSALESDGLLNDEYDDDEDQDNDRIEHQYSKLTTQRILDNFGGTTPRSAPTEQQPVRFPFNQEIWGKTQKIVIPIFVAIGVCAAGMMFLGIFGSSISGIISILAILAMTWLGAIVGMIGTYLYGTIQETIAVMAKENDKFAFNIDQLAGVRSELKTVTKGVFFEVAKLQQDSKELDESLK